jgi:hypothetical protein
MGNFAGRVEKLSLAVNIFADWFLIVAGLVLVCWAIVSIDVASARYLLVVVGVLLTGSGCWFRRLSIKRKNAMRRGRNNK